MKNIVWRTRVVAALFGVLLFWCALDLYGPWHSDLRKFSADATAQFETDLWRAYYSHHPTQLYFGMVNLLRTQQGFPPIRAAVTAYWAGKAATVFQAGHRRSEYVRALPYLQKYFGAICRTGNLDRDTRTLAELELEWWIIHRERGTHGESALIRAIADSAAALYGVDSTKLIPYARFRARAMLNRTLWSQERTLTSTDWDEVQLDLTRAYRALQSGLN